MYDVKFLISQEYNVNDLKCVRFKAASVRWIPHASIRKFMFSLCLQIVQRYDIVLIQEIRDITETAIYTLIDAVNADIGQVLDFTCYTLYTMC